RPPAILLLGTLLAGTPLAASASERAAVDPVQGCPLAVAPCGRTADVGVPELDPRRQAQLGELAARAALAEPTPFALLRTLRQASGFVAVPQAAERVDARLDGECPS